MEEYLREEEKVRKPAKEEQRVTRGSDSLVNDDGVDSEGGCNGTGVLSSSSTEA